MWINPTDSNLVPGPAVDTPAAEPRLSWAEAWYAIRVTLRPHPDAFAAVAGLVETLLAEHDRIVNESES